MLSDMKYMYSVLLYLMQNNIEDRFRQKFNMIAPF